MLRRRRSWTCTLASIPDRSQIAHGVAVLRRTVRHVRPRAPGRRGSGRRAVEAIEGRERRVAGRHRRVGPGGVCRHRHGAGLRQPGRPSESRGDARRGDRQRRFRQAAALLGGTAGGRVPWRGRGVAALPAALGADRRPGHQARERSAPPPPSVAREPISPARSSRHSSWWWWSRQSSLPASPPWGRPPGWAR